MTDLDRIGCCWMCGVDVMASGVGEDYLRLARERLRKRLKRPHLLSQLEPGINRARAEAGRRGMAARWGLTADNKRGMVEV